MHKGPRSGKGVQCNFADEILPADFVDNSGRRRSVARWSSRRLFIGAYYYVAPGLPQAAELRDIKIQVPLQVYSRDGRLIAEFGEMKRTPVAYADVPPLLIKAVLGDRGRALLRASRHRLSRRDPRLDRRAWHRARRVGGSTITQQVPRTLDVMKRAGLNSGFDRFVAKYKEWILAYRMEQEFTKEEILELYLNTSFFGQRSYGVATAAQTYFGKSLGELSVSETAILAGIPQRPTQWNPVYSTELRDARGAPMCCGACSETRAINDERVPGGARRAHRRQGVRSRRGSSRRPTSPRWCEPRWSGASATPRRRPGSR